MSSQAPEKAARFSAKHQLGSWSRKQGAASPVTQFSIPSIPSDVVIGKGLVLARVRGSELNLNGSVTTVDGITLQAGDVVFCPTQIDPVDNGLWVVQPDGAPWVRLSGGLEDWIVVVVRGGTAHGGTVWRSTTDITAVVGTDELYWEELVPMQYMLDHQTTTATTTVYGHVKIDGVTIGINGSGQLVAGLTGTGVANKIVKWSGASTLGYSNAISVGTGGGELAIDTSAMDALYLLQQGNHHGLKIVRNGAGAATAETVRIEAQDTTDGTTALLVTKAGPGNAFGPVHLAHGVVMNPISTGNTTNALVTMTEVELQSNFTPAAGFGVRQNVLLASSTTNRRLGAAQTVEWVTATDASRKARWKLLVSDTAERTAMIAEADGTAVKIGFFGSAAVVKPTALTAIDNSTVDTTYGTQERDVITNTRTRLSELETRLKNLGLLS